MLLPPRLVSRFVRVTPLTRRRLRNFRANARGYWSLWIFLLLFVLSLGAELIANDRPLLVRYDGRFYVPVVRAYAETTFGGQLPTEAAYRDPYVRRLVRKLASRRRVSGESLTSRAARSRYADRRPCR